MPSKRMPSPSDPCARVHSASVVLKPSAIGGVGVFTVQTLKRGELADILSGEDWTFVAEAPETLPEHLWHYVVATTGGYWRPKDFRAMSIGWYLNHSETPNLENIDDRWHATRDIEAGEELTVNYADLDDVEDNAIDLPPQDAAPSRSMPAPLTTQRWKGIGIELEQLQAAADAVPREPQALTDAEVERLVKGAITPGYGFHYESVLKLAKGLRDSAARKVADEVATSHVAAVITRLMSFVEHRSGDQPGDCRCGALLVLQEAKQIVQDALVAAAAQRDAEKEKIANGTTTLEQQGELQRPEPIIMNRSGG